MGKNKKNDKTPFWKRQITVKMENLILILIGILCVGAGATLMYAEAGAFIMAIGLLAILIKSLPYLEAISNALSGKSENKQKPKSQQ